MMEKYFKPKSLTWWAAMAPLVAGLLMATEPLHGITGLAESLSSIFGGASPAILINSGLAGIGLRGAIRDA